MEVNAAELKISTGLRLKLEAAIDKTEYKYFGDYEFSDDQRAAVGLLVEFVAAVLVTSPAIEETAGEP